MTRLSVNINKVATLRNARGGETPNVVQFALDSILFGAEGITIHPRPDERHITYKDVYDINNAISCELNIEGFPDKRFLDMIKDINPDQCTLVPDSPKALTSDHGWDVIQHADLLKSVIGRIKSNGTRVSLFMDNNLNQIEKAKDIGADRIELYTGPYALEYKKDKEIAVKNYSIAGSHAKKLGLGVNAGHDLDLENLTFLLKEMPLIKEVSIGHALISDTLYYGLENTIQMYLRAIRLSDVS
jgi:pyridoxine 5-phosphate synthase